MKGAKDDMGTKQKDSRISRLEIYPPAFSEAHQNLVIQQNIRHGPFQTSNNMPL